MTFTLHGSVFPYGDFLNYLIAFIVIAAVIFFLVVKPVNALMDRMKTEPPVDETVQSCSALPQLDPGRCERVPRSARATSEQQQRRKRLPFRRHDG